MKKHRTSVKQMRDVFQVRLLPRSAEAEENFVYQTQTWHVLLVALLPEPQLQEELRLRHSVRA